MEKRIMLNKGRLQAVDIPVKPMRNKFSTLRFYDKAIIEYEEAINKARSEAIDFRPEDYSIFPSGTIQIKLSNKEGFFSKCYSLKEGETYPKPDGFEIEIEIVDPNYNKYYCAHYENSGLKKCASICTTCKTEMGISTDKKYARLVPIKEQKKEEPSELRQLIWRVVVDTFNSKSNNCSDIYNKIIKEEKDIIELLEQ